VWLIDHGITEQAVPKISRTKRTADEIAEMGTRGEDISAYFTNRFTVVGLVRRAKPVRKAAKKSLRHSGIEASSDPSLPGKSLAL
jgi:hypothetical protein